MDIFYEIGEVLNWAVIAFGFLALWSSIRAVLVYARCHGTLAELLKCNFLAQIFTLVLLLFFSTISMVDGIREAPEWLKKLALVMVFASAAWTTRGLRIYSKRGVR